MDFRLLSFGKSNIGELPIDENKAYASGCYFDWIKLIKLEPNEPGKKNLTIKDSYISVLKSRSEGINSYKVQENLLLISEKEGDFLETSSIVYVSIINLPLESEDVAYSGKDYSRQRRRAAQLIEKEFLTEAQHIRLYHTFEHCDFVLLCDGDKISLADFMNKAKKINNLVHKTNTKEKKVVQDITTIFGILNSNLEKISEKERKEILSISLNLSVQNSRFVDEFTSTLESLNLPTADVNLNLVGRYDHLLLWNSISILDFKKIVNLIQKRQKDLWSYLIHIGIDSQTKNRLKENQDYTSNVSFLYNVAIQKFDSCYVKLSPLLDQPLLLTLREIHDNICSLLKKRIAQYYVLCFFESFYSFLEHLTKKIELQMQKDTDQRNLLPDTKEQIYDMFRTYLCFLNSLNVSTLHTKRQFLRIDSSHLMFFDAPTKLVTFYTAMANKMASILNAGAKDNYTFLLTPDFKKDMFVESLTNDKSVGQEHNILIIHIDEESIYNVPKTLKLIAHEIAHHIGQTQKMREIRAGYYTRCFLAYIVSMSFPEEFLQGKTFKENFAFFSRFIDNLADILFPAEWVEKYETKSLTKEKIVHYSDVFLETFIKHINKSFESTCGDYISTALSMTSTNYIPYIKDFCVSFWQNILVDSSKLQLDNLSEFAKRKAAVIMNNRMSTWLVKNNDFDMYAFILAIFRESYADMQMLLLTETKTTRAKSYANLLAESLKKINNSSNLDDGIRFLSVLTSLTKKHIKIQSIHKFNKLFPDEKITTLEKYSYLYMHNQCVRYLNCLEQPNEIFKKEIDDILKAIKAFEENNLSDIVNCLNKEIYDYRRRLTQ